MRKLYIVGLIAVALLIIGVAIAEEIIFSTYYPAPAGRYREFSTTGRTTLATDEYDIETDEFARVGIGTTDPQAKLDVRGDIFTDRWLSQNSNTFLGVGVCGAGNLAAGSSNNTAIGNGALNNITTGVGNIMMGSYAGSAITITDFNIGIGYVALMSNTGEYNTAIGAEAGYTGDGNSCVFLGYRAGYYETGSNKLFIDNARRANEADARVKALVYGIFDADPANQVLTINGKVGIGTTGPGAQLHVYSTNNDAGIIRLQGQSLAELEEGIEISDANSGETIVGRINFPTTSLTSGGERVGMAFSTMNVGTLQEQVRIDYDGNIGIGTTDPQAKLHLGGTPGPTNGIMFADGTVQTRGFSPASYTGQESVTFPNGMIMKMGFVADTGGSYASVSFDTAFNTLVSITFSEKHATSVSTANISSASASGFTIHDGGTYDGFYWQAIGF